MKCLNVIVYYDNTDEVEKYVNNVAAISEGMVDVIVVINKDTQAQCKLLEERLKTNGMTCFEFLDFGTNVGYLNALLYTIGQKKVNYDYVILSNTDIDYGMEDFFIELSNKKYPEDVGVIAPSVFSTKNNFYQNPQYLKRVSKSHLKRIYRIFKYPFLGKVYLKLAGIKGNRKASKKKDSCYVYSANGSYVILTKKFATLIKDYEYGSLLYCEESCIAELLIKYGMKCFYDSSIEVIHQESTVTGKIDYKKRFGLWRESIKYILEEFY